MQTIIIIDWVSKSQNKLVLNQPIINHLLYYKINAIFYIYKY